MSDYTSADLDSINEAIEKKALGQRVTQVLIRDKQIKYSDATMEELLALRQIIKAGIASDAGGHSYFLTSSSKGL